MNEYTLSKIDTIRFFIIRPSSKKSLFPVQRVAIIVASREAAKSFFFLIYFLHCIEIIWKMLKKKEKNLENVKKCTHSPLIS